MARYLGGLPVTANRGNWLYVSKKFVYRHRGKAVAATAALMAALGGVYVYTTNLALERDIAQRERETAEEVTEFLVGLFRNANPMTNYDGELTARELLERGSARVDEELSDTPVVQSRLNRAMSRAFSGLSLYDESLERAEAALTIAEANDAGYLDLADSLEALASAHWYHENYDDAIRMGQRALDTLEPILGPNDPRLLRSLDLLGTVSYYVDDWDASAKYYERVLALPGISEQNRIIVMGNYTITLEALDRYEEAERAYLESIELRESFYGANHARLAHVLSNYAELLVDLDRPAEAKPYLERALPINLDTRGREHAATAHTIGLLADVARASGDLDTALRHAQEAQDIWAAVTGTGHSRYAATLISLATIYEDAGDYTLARDHAATALDIMVESHGAEHTYSASAHSALGRVYFKMKDYAAAAEDLERAYEIWSAAGMAYRHVVETQHLLGRALLAQQDYAAAEPHLSSVVEFRSSEDSVDTEALIQVLNDHASALDGLGRNDDAQALRDRAAEP